ncbi:polycystin-1-like isoform X2 [Octopus sinensis]|uniref:Polycystin-1-like isoform X2 n=1 Tax=Octopus sinensis TaxID=2607531 RepID=A0A7E6ESH5_9MOLL|nr:polycystin-1-like isoform X2 [Octopus sinensis]
MRTLIINIVLIFVLGFEQVSGGYQGCYKEAKYDRAFPISPGDYDQASISVITCAAACGEIIEPYAALSGGKFCFCGSNQPALANLDNAACTESCLNNPAEKCGDSEHVSVHDSAQHITKLSLSVASKVDSDVSFSVAAEPSSIDMVYSMNYGDIGDNMQSEKNLTGLFDRHYVLPGNFTATLFGEGRDNSAPEVQAVTTVSIETPVVNVTLDCPDVVATHEDFDCLAIVQDGTSLTVTVDIGEGWQRTYPIADATRFIAGQDLAASSTVLSEPTALTYFKLLSDFQWDGVLVGWELKGSMAGNIKLLVLKPQCPSTYCYTTRQCGACVEGMAEICDSNKYCMASNLCDKQTTSSRPAPLATLSYEVISAKSVAITTGYNYIKVDEVVTIKAGYIIGFEKESGEIDATTYNDTDYFIAGTTSEGTAHTVQDMTKSGGSHLLKGIASRTSVLSINHIYTETKDVEIEVIVTGKENSENATKLLMVQEGIDKIIIDSSEFKATQVEGTFSILSHKGNNVTYEWDFDDGVLVNTTDQQIVHVYSQPGTYNVTVSAWNLLSSKKNFTVVFAEESIKDLKIENKPIATTEDAIFQISKSNGSHFQCTLSYGDNSDTSLSTPDFAPTASSTHRYQQRGTYDVTIACSNNVSQNSFTVKQIVVDPITELKLIEEGVLKSERKAINFSIATGSDVSFELTLDGVDYPVTYNPNTLTGSTDLIDWPNYGLHYVIISATNPVSNVTETVEFGVVEEITGANSTVVGEKKRIKVGDDVTYKVTKDTGSDVQTEWIFGDGQTFITPWNDTDQTTHTFNFAGNYTVVVNIFNKQKKVVFTHNVIVLAPIENLTLQSNSPVLFTPPANVNFKFVLASLQVPTDARVDINYGDGNADNLFFDLDSAYYHAYEDVGVFHVTATVSNEINAADLETVVDIIEPLEDLTIKSNPTFAVVNELVQISIFLYRGGNTNVSITWDMGDGTISETPRKGISPHEPDVFDHTYTSVGNYTIKVSVKSILEVINTTYFMVCQQAVARGRVDDIHPRVFTGSQLSVMVNMNYEGGIPPANSYACYFNTTSENEDTKCCIGDNEHALKRPLLTNDQLSLQYNEAGVFIGKLVTCNMVSREEYTFKVSILREITTMTTGIMYQPKLPLNSPGIPVVSNNFPFDLPAIFDISTDGTVENYTVTVTNTDNGDTTIYFNSSSPVTFNWSDPGNYDITISAKNFYSSQDKTIQIAVADSLTGLILSVPKQNKVDNETTIQVSLPTISSSTCLVLDLGDETPAYVYGASVACPEEYKTMAKDSVLNEMSWTHNFATPGTYKVSVLAADIFGNFTSEKLIVISDVQCEPPHIVIREVSYNFMEPLVVKRNKLVRFLTKTTISCKHTLKNIKLWSIIPADPNSGEEIGEPVTLLDNPSINFAELAIEPSILETGFYKVIYNVKMDPTEFPNQEVFQTKVSTYLKIISSDLVIMIENGGASERLWGINTILTLSPEKYSYDPDVPRDGNQGFTNFIWYCSGYKQKYEITEDEGTVGPPSLSSDKGGCFGNGPGKLSFTAGSISFNTQWMKINESYDFLVIAEKGDRKANATLRVKIVDGIPGLAMIECSPGLCTQASTGQVVNPSARIGLTAYCTEGCQTDEKSYEYTWELFYYEYRWDWRKIKNMSEYVADSDKKYLVVSKSIFEDFQNVEKFRAKVTIIDGLTRAETAINILVNKAPRNGSCTISPDSGETGQTVFNLSCFNWEDDQKIEQYMFYAKYKDSSLLNQIAFGIDSTLNVFMPLGPDYDNYKMEVFGKVFDPLGAYTIYPMGTVTVLPMSEEKLQGLLDELNNGSMADLDQVAANGDIQETNTLFTTLASALNSAKTYANNSERASTGYGRDYDHRVPVETPVLSGAEVQELQASKFDSKIEQDRSLRAKGRAKMAEALNTITVSTISGIQLTSSTLSAVCKYTEECGREAQKAVITNIEKMSDTFKKLGRGTPKEELAVAGESLMATIGQALESVNSHITNPIISDMESVAEFMVYDTDLDSEQETISSQDPERGLDELKYVANKDLQTKEAVKESKKLRDSMKTITKTLSTALVPGDEPLNMFTPKMDISISKSSAKSLSDTKFGEGRGAFNLPDWCKMKTDCDPDDIVSLEVMATPGNIYSFAKNKAASDVSGTMSINFMTDDNNDIPIANASEPIEIIIPREKTFKAKAPDFVNPVLVKNETLFYHTFWANNTNSSLHIEIRPDNATVQLLVFVYFNNTPNSTVQSWEHFQMIPSSMEQAENYTDGSWPNPYMLFVSDKIVGNYTGRITLGVRQLEADEMDLYDSNATIPDFKPHTGQFTTNYTLRTFTSGCLYFSETKTDWVTDGCYVGHKTNLTQTQCFCNHMTAFSAGLVVAPNAIDWDRVLNNASFAENPTLYITQIIILLVYLGFAGWSFWQDKKDTEKLGLTPLKDNNPNDKYYYEIIVATGMGKDSGTTSKVYFILSGEYDETEARSLTDDKRQILQRGSVDGFLMAVRRPLGALSYARIWHDNSGKGKFGSWYLKHFLVRDLQTGMKYHFIANKWLAVEEDDGQVDRIIPVAGKEQLLNFSHMFAKRAQKNLGDGHLWFSVIGRPPGSPFTRLQRVSCCLCLLFTSMFANALYYGKESGGGGGFSFGPFSMSIETISMGFVSNLIVLPVNLIIVTLFRKSKPRKEKPSRIEQALKESNETPTVTSVNDVQPLVMTGWDDMSRSQANLIGSDKDLSRPGTSMSRPNTPAVRKKAGGNDDKKNKKKFMFPWWCRIISWILLWLTVAGSCAGVTFYGITFGNEKCTKWISSMLISFFSSVFITEPIKVFGMAILLSLILKKPAEEEEEGEDETLEMGEDEEFLHSANGFGAAKPKKTAYKPPDQEALGKMREQRLKEIKMWEVIKEIIFYAFFLWILMVISYRNRSPWAYRTKYALENILVHTGNDFSEITNTQAFWKWAKNDLVDGLRATKYYNGAPPLMLRGYMSDKTSRIMGYAVMRQLRATTKQCKIAKQFESLGLDCHKEYSLFNEDKEMYGKGWDTPSFNSTYSNLADEFQYQDSSKLDGYPFYGSLNMYGGGGYVARLKGSKTKLTTMMERLQNTSWIDKLTRAVFVEFTIYNPQVNLFTVCTLLAEFTRIGGVVTSYRFEPCMLLPYMTQAALFQTLCDVIFVLFLIYFLIKEVKLLLKLRRKYLKEFWNLVELGIVSLSIAGMFIFIYKLLETTRLTDLFRKTQGNKYMKFQYVAFWNEMFCIIVGWLVFLATLKFMKLLRFNKRMSMLSSTLTNSAPSLLNFSLVFWIFFLSFVQVFYLLFFREMSDFANFITAAETGFLMMMGKFDFHMMKLIQPILCPLIFAMFVVTITFILLNMFLSILNEAFASVKEDLDKQSNEYEIVNFMVGRFKTWTGIGMSGAVSPEEQNCKKSISGNKDGPDGQIEQFPDKVDQLLNSISQVYMEKDTLEAFFDDRNEAGKRALKKILKQSQTSSAYHAFPNDDYGLPKVQTN